LIDIIAIDGPAGSGKSTVARRLAKNIGYAYIDTGAMYRALTLKALRLGLDLDDQKQLENLANNTRLDIVGDASSEIQVMLDDENVALLIRTPELTEKVAYIAKAPGVRDIMKEIQRNIGQRGRSVFEGRDIGTVVFPDSKYKFYIDAKFDERVKRRHKELLEKNKDISYEDLSRDLQIRDHKDMTREVGPLKIADDAVYIDTTDMSIDEVVDKIKGYIV
jgi:CMP/dCMP kinase